MEMTKHNKPYIHKRQKRETAQFYLYILPWIVGFSLFTIIPMISSLVYSFQKVSILDLNGTGTFIGFQNYINIFKDDLFLSSIGNTFLYAFVKTFVSLFLALLFALLLNKKFRGNKLVRILVYLPAIIPSVASIMVWSQLFSKDFSLLNYFLSFFGISPIDWTSYSNSMGSVLLMGIWTSIGPNMLICLAALQGVPEEVIEALKLDGANAVERLFSVTIPTISPTLFFISITGIIGGLQAYAEMQLLFGNGTDKTLTMAWNVVLNAFSLDGSKTMGYACAQAWVLFVIIIIFTAIYFKVSNKLVFYGNGGDK